MKRWIPTAIVILLVFMGLFLLLYPTVSDYVNTQGYRRTIEDLQEQVEELDGEESEALLAAAQAYNERLAARTESVLELTEEEFAEYESLLDLTGIGLMGYVTIEKISVSLPIYHGADETALQRGVGHLPQSSLPVRGESVHTVLIGHNGLTSAKLFTHIDRLAVGDTFAVQTLDETLTYEVDQILTVLPDEIDALAIQEGKEYCTLLTCVPYGVNSHRLLVRGHRIETPGAGQSSGPLPGIGVEIVLLGGAVLLGLLIILAALLRFHPNGWKRYKGHRLEERENATDHTIGDRGE